MASVLNNLKSAIEALTDLLEDENNGGEGGEEEEEEEEEEEPMQLDSGEGESEELKEEEVDAEIVGHALVQINKLLGGLTGSNNKVQGAVPTSGGKASTPKGSSNDGELDELKDDPEKLSKKDNKVGSVNKVGKSIFEQ